MPSKSKAQQKFMGMVHALKKGEMDPKDASPELKKAAQSMKKSDAKLFEINTTLFEIIYRNYYMLVLNNNFMKMIKLLLDLDLI